MMSASKLYRITTKRQAYTIRTGLEHGKADALVIEKTGGWWEPFCYLVFGSNKASVFIAGRQQFFNMQLFSSAWQHSFNATFENRFRGLSKEEAKAKRKELILEWKIRSGLIEPIYFTLGDGKEIVAYKQAHD